MKRSKKWTLCYYCPKCGYASPYLMHRCDECATILATEGFPAVWARRVSDARFFRPWTWLRTIIETRYYGG